MPEEKEPKIDLGWLQPRDLEEEKRLNRTVVIEPAEPGLCALIRPRQPSDVPGVMQPPTGKAGK